MAALLSRPNKDRHLPTVLVGGSQITLYNPELALAICERIAHGETLRSITQRPEFPSQSTVQRWVIAYPKFADAYHSARELSSYALEDEALDNARLIRMSPGDSAKVRAFDVAINQLRWSASRRNPRVYSERAAVQITVPIQIVTSMNLDAGTPVDKGTAEDPNSIYDIAATLEQEMLDETPPQEREPLLDGSHTKGHVRRKIVERKPRKRGQYG